MRCFISAAAARVKVSTSSRSTGVPAATMRVSRSVSTAVLPAPAAADTITLPRASMARSCACVQLPGMGGFLLLDGYFPFNSSKNACCESERRRRVRQAGRRGSNRQTLRCGQ